MVISVSARRIRKDFCWEWMLAGALLFFLALAITPGTVS